MGGRLLLIAAGVVAAALALVTVQSSHGLSPVDPGVWGMAVLLVPGLAAVVAGAGTATAGSLAHSGILLALVGIAWIVGAWDAPGSPSPLVFTAGLVADSAALALAAHLLLGYPGGRLRGRARFVLVAAGYVVLVGVVGIAPTLFFAPASTGCPQCPSNLLLRTDNPAAATALGKLAGWLGVAWITAVVLVVFVGRLTRRLPPTRDGTVWVIAAGIGFLVFGGLRLVPLGSFEAYRAEFSAAQATMLVLLATALGWARLRWARAQRRLVRLTLGLDHPGDRIDLAAAIGQWLGDPTLSIAYPVTADRYVDRDGAPVYPTPAAGGYTVTQLRLGDQPLAALSHRAGLLNDPRQVPDLLAVARLGLVNERLRAQRAAQLADLRASRLRLVESADEERRRLERDLHDGAQQRLVSLALALRRPVRNDRTGHAQAAADGVGRAGTALREFARGIYPTALSQGVGPALQGLGESTGIALTGLPTRRLPPVIEATAYQVAAWAATTGAASLRIDTTNPTTTMTIRFPAARDPIPSALTDRVQAVGGTIIEEGHEDTPGATIAVHLPASQAQ